MSDALQKIADQYVSKEKFSGIEWRVEKNQSCLFQGQAGYADFEKKTPIPKNAIYRIYSMTKPIISVLALQLIEQESFSLTDPISYYDERFSAMTVLHANGEIEPANTLITVKHLLPTAPDSPMNSSWDVMFPPIIGRQKLWVMQSVTWMR